MSLSSLELPTDIYTVSRLNNEVRFILEDAFPYIWVEGEISNFAAPHSGHWYFCLKDQAAQVRCAMFKSSQRRLHFTPKDGAHVLIKARVSLYENRGEFQLIAEEMEERGEGKLRRAFEALKKKLEAEGLFSAEHKKPIPAFPQQIGVITSATGAAIRDILIVLKRRHAALPVIIYPTLVQGDTAAPAIVRAIQTANRRKECDVLIVARGGGSLEDLWPFNEEGVARAIFASDIPIISGVGHEVDFTIADFTADLRAPTPSAAAELASPDQQDLMSILLRHRQTLLRIMRHQLTQQQQQLNWMQKHLSQQHPKRKLREKMQQLDFFELQLIKLMHQVLNQSQQKLSNLNHRLRHQAPFNIIRKLQAQLQLDQQQFQNLISSQLNDKKFTLANAATTLDTLSPLATLNRGYAIVSKPNQEIIRSATEVKTGDELHIRLAKGSIDCIVK